MALIMNITVFLLSRALALVGAAQNIVKGGIIGHNFINNLLFKQ